jgi:predicted nucleic acid-binding protein
MITSAGYVGMDNISARSLVYIDTNVFIYFVESTPNAYEKAKAIFELIAEKGARIATNEITLAECIYKPSQDSDARLVEVYERLFDKKSEIAMLTLDGALAKRAAQQGSKLGLKLIDAIHYLSALEAGCDVFVTSDKSFKSGPKMRVFKLS